MLEGIRIIRVTPEAMERINAHFMKLGDSAQSLAGIACYDGRGAKEILQYIRHPDATGIHPEDRAIFLVTDLGDANASVERHERRHHGIFLVSTPSLRELGNKIVKKIEANPEIDPQIAEFINNRRKANYPEEQLLDEVLAEGLLRVKGIRQRAEELGISLDEGVRADLANPAVGAVIVLKDQAAPLEISPQPLDTVPIVPEGPATAQEVAVARIPVIANKGAVERPEQVEAVRRRAEEKIKEIFEENEGIKGLVAERSYSRAADIAVRLLEQDGILR